MGGIIFLSVIIDPHARRSLVNSSIKSAITAIFASPVLACIFVINSSTLTVAPDGGGDAD
jgi:hypothetical protein